MFIRCRIVSWGGVDKYIKLLGEMIKIIKMRVVWVGVGVFGWLGVELRREKRRGRRRERVEYGLWARG